MNRPAMRLFLVLLFLIPSLATTRAQTPDWLQRHQHVDRDHDGNPEIRNLSLLEPLSPGKDQPDLLVLIERRLLDNDQELQPTGSLTDQLRQYSLALQQDGYQPAFIVADLDKSERHQDGLTLLAMRDLLKDVHQSCPGFQGAVLLGSFPESMLVRRWAWLHDSRSVTFKGVTYNHRKGPQATYLAFDPELISQRTDVVLTDLDGNWDELYVQPPTEIDSIKLIPDDPSVYQAFREQPIRFQSERYSISPKTFQDFFFIDDADLKVIDRTDESLTLETSYRLRRPELPASGPQSTKDHAVANPLAMPEIMVSRINALHVAANPPASALDPSGTPQVISDLSSTPNKMERSPELERDLLVQYFQRNLLHRQGIRVDDANRAALLTTDLRTFDETYLKNLSSDFANTLAFHRATAVDFVRFMKTPALVKGISAHSNPNLSVLLPGYQQADLLEESGGGYWYWQNVDQKLVPSYQDNSVCNSISTPLLRALWHNGKLKDAGGCFYIHAGCEAMSPNHAEDRPYHDPAYGGQRQIAESLLFYGNGLALIGRAKVFYDRPTQPHLYFNQSSGRFGDMLTGYFQQESASEQMGSDVAGRNRVYFWSIVGDWTLRLNYPASTTRTLLPSGSDGTP